MTAPPSSSLLLCALVSFGCGEGKQEPAPADGKTGAAGAKAAEGADGAAGPQDADAALEGKAADAAANAAGGAVAVDPNAVTDCPASLQGRDEVDRVITKECGVVPVTGDYSIEGATLTLQPGATLAFAEGAKLSVGYYEPAKLVVNGTAQAPVTFTTSGDHAAGVWEGVTLYEHADRSALEGLVIEYAGKKTAALHVEAEDVTIAGCTVRSAKEHAIEVAREGSITLVGSTIDDVGPIAMQVTATAAGGIEAGNHFPAGSRVSIQAGRVADKVTWAAIGTPWLLTGRVQVHGESGRRATLTVAAGAELRFDGDGSIDVGYYDQGTLVAEGSAAAPIVFAAHERQEPGGWSGLRIYGKGEARFGHARFVDGGSKDNEGALLVEGTARVSLQDVTFQDDAVGVVVQGKNAELLAFDRVAFAGTPIAVKAAARYLGAMGAANRYEGDAKIVAEADKIDRDMAWKRQEGARVELDGGLQVSGGRLTVEPGITLHVKDGVELQVGYYDTAALELRGTAEAPITIRGQRDEPGAWGGMVFYGKAKGNVLEHVVLRNAGGQAGARFDGEANAKIDGLRCDDCTTPTLKWTCKGTIEHTGVEAGEGTPAALEAPVCK